jgi:hypothetical protein
MLIILVDLIITKILCFLIMLLPFNTSTFSNILNADMEAVMQKYHEIHGQDGVVLCFCFLHHFAGTTTENIIEAYSLLSESKVKLSL